MPIPLLLVNPPLVNGVAFTRQGRCQEREEVLGTTKPPYTLALAAALLRDRGLPCRLIDLTAERRSTVSLIDELRRERFTPGVVVFPSTVPTLHADTDAMSAIKRAFGAPLVCFGPHASASPGESMARAPDVDAMIVGEPEDTILALATAESRMDPAALPSVTWRQGHDVIPHTTRGTFSGFASMPFPAWDLLHLKSYRLPLVASPYLIVETSRGCPYSCDFCVAPLHQGQRFLQRSAAAIVDEIERGRRELGVRYFYLWGDTVTLNVKAFAEVCDEIVARQLDVHWFGNARADNLVDPAFVHLLKRSGCWMLGMGIESASADTRRDMIKQLEDEKIRAAFANLRHAGIRSLAFFIFGYPGDTVALMDRTVDYALELDADFANFYPAVPYPGTELYDKCRREGLLASDDWSRLEYSHYVLGAGDLDERALLGAIMRARRRFYLRPGYLARHLSGVVRLVTTKPAFAIQFLRQKGHDYREYAGGSVTDAGSTRT
jgi:anaerobic magnesium-protoporphyrin IX monomethyl ester cyclase